MLFENPYTLRIEESEGIPRYYVSFADGEGIRRETEISRPVFKGFEKFARYERNLTRWGERHIERFEQTDEMLRAKVAKPPKELEDEVFDCQRDERLRQAVAELPEIQRRRFVLYHEFGMTYEQIGEIEGCSKMSAKRSVDRAAASIREVMNGFYK